MQYSPIIKAIMHEYGLNVYNSFKSGNHHVHFFFNEEPARKSHVCEKKHKRIVPDKEGNLVEEIYACGDKFSYTKDLSVHVAMAEFDKDLDGAYKKMEKRWLKLMRETIEKMESDKELSVRFFPKQMYKDIRDKTFFVKIGTPLSGIGAFSSDDERDNQAKREDMKQLQLDNPDYIEEDTEIERKIGTIKWIEENFSHKTEEIEYLKAQVSQAKMIVEKYENDKVKKKR
jgi:hypothetical protein